VTAAETDPQVWVEALRDSHDGLAKLVAGLDADELGGPSYATDWSIAQVLSHLGSQAVIFSMFLDAALAGTEAPGVERFHPVWDEWNARDAVAQRDESVQANEELVSRIEGLDDATAGSFRLALFGTDLDLPGFARMRLSEHAVHSWDVAVALDPDARIDAGSVQLLLDTVGPVATRSGQPAAEPFTVLLRTTDPARDVVVSVGTAEGSVSLEAAAESTSYDGEITLPAEAYLRLLYGRLDAEHTPEVVESGGRTLSDLRAVFRGF